MKATNIEFMDLLQKHHEAFKDFMYKSEYLDFCKTHTPKDANGLLLEIADFVTSFSHLPKWKDTKDAMLADGRIESLLHRFIQLRQVEEELGSEKETPQQKQTSKQQYQETSMNCYCLFQRKTMDYGLSWCCMRVQSLTDQLLIKAIRVRSIQEKGSQQVQDSVQSEFIGLYNYSIMALIMLKSGLDLHAFIGNGNQECYEDIFDAYEKEMFQCEELFDKKNSDYADIWRNLRIESITDLILSKIYRLRQIESNGGKVEVSENVEAIYQDIANYAIFALILMS